MNIKKDFTTIDIAKMIGVYRSTVAYWIDDGKMKAFVTPGGHRRIKPEDLLAFLKKYDIPIPENLTELSNLAKIKVLIVDDDRKVLKSFKELLKHRLKNSLVYTAGNGFEAGHLVTLHRPNIVLLDLIMPEMDGFEACRLIKKFDKKIKVIAITGHDSVKNKEKILKAGADHYMVKPVNGEELMGIIKKFRIVKV
jgi:excisionase family DNA binding protein